MSTWQFLIDLGSGWIDLTDYDGNGLSLVTRDGIALERQLHNGGRSVIDRLQFELARAPASLLRDLYQQPTYELVPIRVDRDGARWFTGYLRPIDTYDGEPAAGALERVVQLEAVDVLWKLQRTLATAYDQNEQTVDAIVRDLLQRAGFSASDFAFSTTLTQTVANIRERPDDREILEILDDLLFEYHHVMVATEDGKIDLFDWLDDGATPVATLQETIGAESHEKTDEDYGYVVASYLRYDKIESIRDYINVHRSIPDSLRDLAGGDTATARLDLSERVPDGAVVVGAENLEIWLQLYNTTTDARYWAPVRPSRFPVDGVERTGTFTRSGTLALKMDVTASLDAADEAIDLELTLYPDLYESDAALAETWGPLPYDIDLIAVSVYGTILYQQVAGEVREETSAAGESTARREKYEAKYVFDRADAQALAAAILQLRQYGSREWRRRSTSYLPLGSVVTVESATLDLSSRGRIVRLIDAQQNATDDGLQEYAYIIENLDTATSTDNSAPESVPSAPAFPPSAGEIADRPTFGDIAGGVGVTGPLDDLPAPALSATATTRKVSLSVGYSREIVGGSVRCELQISDDGTSWFSLGPGGNGPDDWKGLADEVTQIVGTSYIHDQLPLGGTAADPLTTTYYYRARIVASSLVSEWSAAVTVDVSPVLEGDIGANSVTANKINVADLFSEQITIGAGGYIKSANNAWRIDENSAEFAGWSVAPGVLMSPTGVVEISAENARFQVNDAFGVAKVVSGYLAGLPDGQGGTFGADVFGDYYGPGARVVMESGAEYVQGAYNINADAAFVVNAGDMESVRLGSLGAGDIGLDIGGMQFGPVLGGGGATGTFETTVTGGGGATGTFGAFVSGGGNARYGTSAGLLYSLADDRLYLTGTLVGVDGEFSGSLKAATGTFSGALEAATGTFSGALEAATGTFSGLVSGGSIDIGSGDFTVDSSGNVVASSIDIAGGVLSGEVQIEASGSIVFSDTSASGGSYITADEISEFAAPEVVGGSSFVEKVKLTYDSTSAYITVGTEGPSGFSASQTIGTTGLTLTLPSSAPIGAPTGYVYRDASGFVRIV